MMMFRPMREEEYPAYLEYFIADYAREIAANYRLSAEDSLTKATREIAEDLPEGVNTPGQVLLSLFSQSDNRDEHVGYLNEVAEQLRDAGLRADVGRSGASHVELWQVNEDELGALRARGDGRDGAAAAAGKGGGCGRGGSEAHEPHERAPAQICLTIRHPDLPFVVVRCVRLRLYARAASGLDSAVNGETR